MQVTQTGRKRIYNKTTASWASSQKTQNWKLWTHTMCQISKLRLWNIANCPWCTTGNNTWTDSVEYQRVRSFTITTYNKVCWWHYYIYTQILKADVVVTQKSKRSQKIEFENNLMQESANNALIWCITNHRCCQYTSHKSTSEYQRHIHSKEEGLWESLCQWSQSTESFKAENVVIYGMVFRLDEETGTKVGGF